MMFPSDVVVNLNYDQAIIPSRLHGLHGNVTIQQHRLRTHCVRGGRLKGKGHNGEGQGCKRYQLLS